ncbi:hypothetical protein ACFL14_00905 [Patescibacteria group bacterium]
MTENMNIFYNLLPGTVFFSVWCIYLYGESWKWIIEKVDNSGEVSLGIFLLASWVIGFTIQALWSNFKRLGWVNLDERICTEKAESKRIIMAVLWANDQHALTRNFYHRAALWGHFIVGSLITILLAATKLEWSVIPVWLGVGIVSFYFYYYYKVKEVGSALLTFRELHPEKWACLNFTPKDPDTK